jgi:DNA polymerase-1
MCFKKLSSKSDIVKYILEFRGLQKLKSTYVDALPALVNPKTGRVHTTFNQSIAATGRLSSTQSQHTKYTYQNRTRKRS